MSENETNTNTYQKYLKATTILIGIVTDKIVKDTVKGDPCLSFKIPVQNEYNLIKIKFPIVCFRNEAINLNQFQMGDLVAVGGVINHYFKVHRGQKIVKSVLHARAIAKVKPLDKPHEYKINGEIFGDKSYLYECERIAS